MICQLLRKFINNEIKSQKEYINFLGILKSLIRKTAVKYEIDASFWEDNLEDIANDLLIKIYKASVLWKTIANKKECKAYLYITIRNLLLDIVREKERTVKERHFRYFEDKEGEEVSEEEFLEDENNTPEVKEAIVDLIEYFKSKVKREEVKYFCYFLTPGGKKLYKCLWGDKSNDAIYQDAKRKKNKVVLPLLKEWAKLGVDREVVELFIKTYLSEICEKLRSLYCKEA